MASIANSLPNQLPPLDLFAGLSILVIALYLLSIILGGFTVRRVDRKATSHSKSLRSLQPLFAIRLS